MIILKFYKITGHNSLDMHWEWSTGYRFVKIEGFFSKPEEPLSIHIGSTTKEKDIVKQNSKIFRNAYREITLNFPKNMKVGRASPIVKIKADFDALLSGKANTIYLLKKGEKETEDQISSVPSIHSADGIEKFLNNPGGDGKSDLQGMFAVIDVMN